MTVRFARLACGLALAAALPGLALAQRTISLGGSAPADAAPVAAVNVPAVDPATLQGLPTARDYRAPDGIGFRAADFFSENVRLTAEWFWAGPDDGKTLPTVIIAPGGGATAASLRQDALDLARAGYLVMLFDYRGWGDSDGRVVRTGVGEVRELRGYLDPTEQVQDWYNAFAYAAADPRVDTGRMGVMGSDLAGGHVVQAAAHEPRISALVSEVTRGDTRPSKPYQLNPAKVIAEADAAASRLATGQAAYPSGGAPVGNKVARWEPIHDADDVDAPALFVLAEKEELFANTANGQLACERVIGPRKLIMLPKITHYGVYGPERPRAIKAAIDWFDKYLKTPPTPASRKAAERGPCNPPPLPPAGEEPKDGSGQGHKSPATSDRFN